MEEILNRVQESINQKDKAAIEENEKFASEEDIDIFLKKQFPEVVPTLREHYMGRLSSYKMAAARMIEEEKEQKKQERISLIKKMWSVEEMYDVAVDRGNAIAKSENFKNGFVIDEDNREVFKMLCEYFTNDPAFEQRNIDGISYSLKKGIWLQSSERGTGKSTLLRCFQYNKRSCFGYMHTSELGSMYQKRGFNGIDDYIGLIQQPPSAVNFYQSNCGFLYDEIFGDSKVNHMGTPLLISEYIINKLYDFSNNLKGQAWKFHCTSNATGEDIEQVSGKTFRSRMPDMFNLIKLGGKNRRIF